MYKIGIDARLYGQTGVGVYLNNLLFHLEKIKVDKIIFYVYLLPEDAARIKFGKNSFRIRIVKLRWHSLAEQISLPRYLYSDNLDLMHFTYFSYPVLYRKKFLSTIHDITPFHFKTGKASTKSSLLYEIKHLAYRFVISEQIKRSAAIITPTKAVKKQLTEIYGESYSGKIYPIYEGVDRELRQAAQEFAKDELKAKNKFKKFELINKNFLIYVGNFYPHKNVEKLVEAFATIKTDVKLLLIGPDDFFARRLAQLSEQLNQKGKIVFFHNPSKTDLVYFYKNALALVHPSLSEGFGLPLVEATYFKLPVIASNIGVFREILGDNFVSFDPRSAEDIASKVNDFLSNKNREKHNFSLREYSFEKMTKETFQLYLKLLG